MELQQRFYHNVNVTQRLVVSGLRAPVLELNDLEFNHFGHCHMKNTVVTCTQSERTVCFSCDAIQWQSYTYFVANSTKCKV